MATSVSKWDLQNVKDSTLFPSEFGSDPGAISEGRSPEEDSQLYTENPSNVFDYRRFTSYLKIQNDLERQLRIQEVRRGTLRPWLSIDFYTDSVLQAELTSIYGELDTTSDLYLKIFASYKVSRLDEISRWVREEKEIIHDLITGGHQVIDVNYQIPKESRMELDDFFSNAELLSFLGVTDPQCVFQPFCLPRIRSTTSPSVQTSRLGQTVAQHVTGILPVELYLETNPGQKFWNRETIDTFSQQCTHEPNNLFMQEIGFADSKDKLLFPAAACKLITTPRMLFTNILHKLELIFVLDNPHLSRIPVPEAVQRFEDLFRFRLSPRRLKAWGFLGVVPFVTALLKLYNAKITLSDAGGGEYCILAKQQTSSEPAPAQLQEEGNKIQNESVPKPDVRPSISSRLFPPAKNPNFRIPLECMQFGASMETVSGWISSPHCNRRKSGLKCVLINYFTPTDFYVTLVQELEQLTRFQRALNSAYAALDCTAVSSNIRIGPHFEFRAGLYLIVAQVNNTGDTEYYRGEYVQKQYDGRHRIFFIDYGEFVNVDLSQLRFLRKDLAYELRSQSVWCALYNILPQTNWQNEVIDAGYNLMSHRSIPLWVKFVNQITFKGKPQWFVTASGINSKKYPDVGEVLKKILPSLEVKL